MKRAVHETRALSIATLGGELVIEKFCPKGYFMVRISGRNYVVKSLSLIHI